VKEVEVKVEVEVEKAVDACRCRTYLVTEVKSEKKGEKRRGVEVRREEKSTKLFNVITHITEHKVLTASHLTSNS
jgi:hypothetical protein